VDIKILVDDGNSDRTGGMGVWGLHTFVHAKNYGYGRNQQTCFREAADVGAEVIINSAATCSMSYSC
jgi:hypothetical protein